MAGKRLLIVSHAPLPNTERLRDALVAGARSPEIEGVEVTALGPFATTPAEVLSADAIILGATENLGYMSGALKDFFDRCYCPCLGLTEGTASSSLSEVSLESYLLRQSSSRRRWSGVSDPRTAGVMRGRVLRHEGCRGGAQGSVRFGKPKGAISEYRAQELG